MHCFKHLGQRVIARTFDRQITGLRVRAAVLNRFSEMGRPVTIRVALYLQVKVRSGSRDVLQQSPE